ncbi:hypothetical protein FIA58_011325 [Flavobacterium jejuense]|uniref:Lipoprotein n=1 Tax=Flavobacterium jejuense TaxID=1544455 RepID=A0ABX0ITW5_9FLAO|nr:hypothetical protein [Flavobacterium jejuense]NHN26269.1 hypothetical protein [Flavobacterium jejuense]
MKTIFILFSFAILSCNTNKKIESETTNCEIIIVPKEQGHELVSIYKDIDTSCFFKNQFVEFDKINNGILYYQRTDGHEFGNFLTIDFDANFSAVRKYENFSKPIEFVEEDKKVLDAIWSNLITENYYQPCKFAQNHFTMYLLIIKKNNKIVVNYFSPFESLFYVKPINENFKNTQIIFEIVYRNSFQ